MWKRVMSAVALFAGAVSVSFAQTQGNAEGARTPPHPTAVMVHRSAEIAGTPENSLAWIENAIGLGVGFIHINPQITADDRYVLMHDNTLNRTTNVEAVFPVGPPGGPTREQRWGKDYVRDYTLEDIRQLELVNGQDGGQHRVPTLEEAVKLVDGRVVVLLGLKSYEIDSLAAALEEQDTQNLLLFELYFSGTDQRKLRDAADATGLDVAAVLYRSSDYIADLEQIREQLGPRLKMVSVGSPKLTPAFLARIEELELRLMISGWNGPEDSALVNKGDVGPWKEALKAGSVASTDYPELLLEALGQ